MKHKLKKTISSLLCLVMALLLATTASANEGASLTVYHERENVKFDIYYVAETGTSGWQPTDDFADYPVALPDESSSSGDWRNAAETLAAFVAQDGLTPISTDRISGGKVTFPELEEGLYLIIGETVQENNVRYVPSPSLVHVRGDTEVTVKAEEIAVTPEKVEYRVTKVWQGGESHRSLSVAVQLLCDGSLEQSVTLSPLNGWSYTWESTPGHLWQVVEQNCPQGFAVSVEQDGTNFTITNTWQTQESEQPAPTSSPERPSGGTPAPSTPAGEGSLPQTGQLWWPVLLLLALGVICVGIGQYRSYRKRKQNHES